MAKVIDAKSAIPERPRRSFLAGLLEDAGGGAALDDPAFAEDVDGLGNSPGEVHGVVTTTIFGFWILDFGFWIAG